MQKLNLQQHICKFFRVLLQRDIIDLMPHLKSMIYFIFKYYFFD